MPSGACAIWMYLCKSNFAPFGEKADRQALPPIAESHARVRAAKRCTFQPRARNSILARRQENNGPGASPCRHSAQAPVGLHVIAEEVDCQPALTGWAKPRGTRKNSA